MSSYDWVTVYCDIALSRSAHHWDAASWDEYVKLHFYTDELLNAALSFSTDLSTSVLWRCQLGDRKGIWPVKKLDDGLLVVMTDDLTGALHDL